MGQKINPNGIRIGINRTWDSRWFADGASYANFLHQDLAVQEYVKKELSAAGVSRVIIERPAKTASVTIRASRPGVIIGKKGADIEKLKKKLSSMMGTDVQLNIVEVRKPDTDAQIAADSIANQLKGRVSYRRAMKKAIQAAMRGGAEGIRVLCSGRLAGAEIARKEEYREGRVPLHTLRGDVDYAESTAFTTYGATGIKVWIFKGEVMERDPMAQDKRLNDGYSGRK